MKRIELIFNIENLSFLYEEKSISWQDAEFTTKTNFSADLKIWADEVEPEQIMESWKKLNERCEPFLTAMKYKGNRQITSANSNYPTYYYEDNIFTPRCEAEAQIITQYLRGKAPLPGMCYAMLPALRSFGCSMPSPPLQLPAAFPFIPLCLRGLAATITLVDELANYPDLQLKLAYMVLEELVETQESQDFQDIKNARNFVSHALCDRKNFLPFIKRLFPSAMSSSGTSAKFDREKNDHRSFVSSFARKAHQWAKNEFEYEVIKQGGSIS